MINIDKDKLAERLLESIDDTMTGYWESESFCIGEVKGLQVVVQVTKSFDDFLDIKEDFICITEGK